MPEQLLHRMDVVAALEEMRGEGMAQRMEKWLTARGGTSS
jgi:hypothetical protein